MDLKLQPFDFNRALAKAGMAADGTRLHGVGHAAKGVAGSDSAQSDAGDSFRTAMSNALQSVSNAQLQAESMQREFQLGNPSVSLEDTMLSMQKAQLGFQATLSVRSRLVQAYTDVMNMQV